MRYTLSLLIGAGIAGRRVMLCATVFALFGSICSAMADETEKRVERLVKQLGSENFDEREHAGKELIEVGAPALAELRRVARSTDPEVAHRARMCIPVIEINGKVMAIAAELRSKSAEERAGCV